MAILGNSNKNRYDSSSMEDLENLLFSSKQVKSNSEDMEAVYRALIAVNAFHNKTIDVKDYASVNKAQANLVAACDNYLQVKGNKLHRTVGKDRLDIVRAISNLAKQEDFRDIDYKRFEGKTWGELRGEQRTLTKTLSDDTKLVTAGANSSSRNVFDEGYFTHSINRHRYGSHELFRDEVYNNMFRKDQELITPYMDEIFDEYLKTSHTSDAVLLATKDLKKRLESIPSFANLPSEKQDLIFSKGIEFQKAIANLGNVGPGNSALIPDDDVDLSLHNVATSRLAEMCGAPDIVAKSQKMIVSENGIEHHGVVMANAVGMDYSKMNKEEKTVFSQADTSDPEFQRQANRLMILDMISGQTDRNIGNAFYQIEHENGKPVLKGLQGIDNDIAFGNGLLSLDAKTYDDENFRTRGNFNLLYGVKERRGHIGLLTDIKVIDKRMFEQLKGINKETLQYMFSDVLNADAISYMNERVNQIVDYVEKNDVKIVDTFDKDTYKLMKSCPVMYRVEESQNKIKKLFAMEAAKEAKKKAAEEAEKKADEEPKKEQAAEEPKKEEAAEAPKRKPAPTAPQRKQAPEEPKKEDAPEAPKRKPAPTAPKRVATNFKELSKSDWKSQSSPREQKFTIGRSRDKKPAEKKPSGLGMQ